MAESASTDNVIVLLDRYTCGVVNGILYDSLSKHVQTMVDIREISNSNYGADVVIFESSCPAVVTREIAMYLIDTYNLKLHVIYQKDEIGELFKDIANCVKANYSTIEWNLIYAVLNRDSAILETYSRTQEMIGDYSSIVDTLPPDCVGPVNRMYRSYLYLSSEFGRLVTKVSKLEEIIGNYRTLGHKTTEAIEELQKLLASAVKDNQIYSAMLSESYDKTFSGMYTSRPRILYIRQVMHLSGVDLLLVTLYTVLTKQYKSACKVLKLVDSTNAIALRYVPNLYYPLNDSYDTSAVLSHDFLMNLGSYNMLMNLLMLNRSGLEILIVHDCRGTQNSALDASLIDLQLNELSSDYALLKEYDSVLSDYSEADFRWAYSEVSKYAGTNSAKLAAHPTITSILEYLL